MLGSQSGVKRALSFRRFVPNRPLRVLVVRSGYHLQRESWRALLALGHEAYELDVRVGGPAAVIRLLVEAMVRVRPDFVLFINHIGFDDCGGVGNLFEWLQVPIAVWYVDSPFFVIKNMKMPAPSVSSVFLWERSLVPLLRQSNVSDVHYLPLACELEQFAHKQEPLRYDVSFVGNSMVHADAKWKRDMAPRTLEVANAWRQELLADRKPMAHRALELLAQEPALPAWDILASATFSATGAYRMSLLNAVDQTDLHLFGDKHWPEVLPDAHWHGMLGYGPALADSYRRSAINLNATSMQMPEAVNQRVFDCPAAGGFLLSDHQVALQEHFELGTEAIAYEGPDHLRELVAHYRRRPAQRQAVIDRAYQRIVRCHTYDHRLQAIVEHMRRRYGPMRTPPPRAGPYRAPMAPRARRTASEAEHAALPNALPPAALCSRQLRD